MLAELLWETCPSSGGILVFNGEIDLPRLSACPQLSLTFEDKDGSGSHKPLVLACSICPLSLRFGLSCRMSSALSSSEPTCFSWTDWDANNTLGFIFFSFMDFFFFGWGTFCFRLWLAEVKTSGHVRFPQHFSGILLTCLVLKGEDLIDSGGWLEEFLGVNVRPFGNSWTQKQSNMRHNW